MGQFESGRLSGAPPRISGEAFYPDDTAAELATANRLSGDEEPDGAELDSGGEGPWAYCTTNLAVGTAPLALQPARLSGWPA